MPAVLIDQKKGKEAHDDHEHTNLTTERFVNRPDIEFQRCADCGDKIYPPGFFQVFGGSSTTIMWPTPDQPKVLLDKEDKKGSVREWLSKFLVG